MNVRGPVRYGWGLRNEVGMMGRGLPRLAATMAMCVSWLACGNPDRGVTGPMEDGGAGDDGSIPRTDGGTPPPPTMTASCGGELTVADRLVSLGYEEGLLQPSTRRVISFPEELSPSLGAMPVLTLTEEGGGRIDSVAVTGDVPDGKVYGATYQPTLDRFVVLTWTRTPEPHYALGGVELTESEARFVTYELVDPLPSDGYQIQDIYAISGPRVAMLRGIDTLYQVVIDGETATFSSPMPVDTAALPSTVVPDADHDRLIGYGLSYDPMMPFEDAFVPYVATLSLETGGAWVELAASGEVPETLHGADASSFYEPYAAYDPSRQRLTVAHARWEDDPFFPGERTVQPLLYSLDLRSGTWSLVSEDPELDVYSSGSPWLVDPEMHRGIVVQAGHLRSFHLEGDMVGRYEAEPLEGTSGIRFMVTAAALPDGRIAATDRWGRLVILETAGVPAWSAVGDAEVPIESRAQGALVYDEVDDSLLLIGGASTDSDPGSGAVHRIALDGSSVELVATTGELPPRTGATVIAHDGVVYVAGGWVAGGVEAATYDDVWALDLRTLEWSQRATIGVGRADMGALVSGGELWLIGGWNESGSSTLTGVARVDAVDLSTGSVREVTVSGEWPARNGIFYGDGQLGDAFFTFDIVDDTIDGNAADLWLLMPDGAGGAAWQPQGSCLRDALVSGTIGVSLGDQVWAVGEHAFSVSR